MMRQTASQKLSAKIKTATQKLKDMKNQLIGLKDKEKSQATASKTVKVKKTTVKKKLVKKVKK